MNSLRVTNKELYEIEVNDNGDKISFAMNDIDLPLKIQKAWEDIQKIIKKCEDLQNREMKDVEKTEDEFFSSDEMIEFKTISEAYVKLRKVVDAFLGEGACQKIFGDNNWITMYDDLFTALEPHFKKMGILSEVRFNQSIEEKYKDEEDVL